MPNLRIVSVNAADTGTTTVSTTAGTLVAANLRSDTKSLVWRARGTSASLRHVFLSPTNVGFVGLIHSNASQNAQIRVRATNEAAGTNLLTVVSGQCESWGSAPASVRYVQAPDGTYTAVVPKPDAASDRWQFDIPANTFPNGTVLVMSWHQKTVAHTGTGGQTISPVSWVGATPGTVNNISSVNGYTRKWVTVTITATGAIQNLRFYFPVVGADDIAGWGWQLELGTTPTSYYPTLATFVSRASSGTYLDANGLIATAASGAARMQYQYPSGAAVAARLLVEAAATNLMLHSEALSNAVYTKGNVTVGAAGIGPSGANTALSLVESTASTLHYLQQIVSLTTGTTYTLSTFVKSNGRTRMQLSNASLGAFAKFNLSTASVASTGGAGYQNSTIDELPNGWYRLSLTFLTAATASQSMILYLEDNNTGSTTFAGTGTSGVYNWGWQLEAGSTATSYIATTTTSATRALDNYTVAAGVRPVGYMDWWQSYGYDSGYALACPAARLALPGLTAAQAASAYAYGGGEHARAWTTITGASAVMVDVLDAANLQGYLEASRLVIGPYWEAAKNADYGAGVSPGASGKHTFNDAGDLITERRPRNKKLTIALSKMEPIDRDQAWSLLNGNGMDGAVFASLYPESADINQEAMHQIYGRLVTTPSMTSPLFNLTATTLEIQGV